MFKIAITVALFVSSLLQMPNVNQTETIKTLSLGEQHKIQTCLSILQPQIKSTKSG